MVLLENSNASGWWDIYDSRNSMVLLEKAEVVHDMIPSTIVEILWFS